ncbi:MAG: hypothetical protein RIC14_00145 [Filomicrobium sp.]
MTKPTLAKQIMELNDGVLTTRQIADQLGTSDSYVRVVLRQRKGSGMSDIDHRYQDRNRATLNAKSKAYHNTFRRTGDRELARKAAREAT